MPRRQERRRIELPPDPLPGETAAQKFAARIMLYEAYCALKDSLLKHFGENDTRAFLRNRAKRAGRSRTKDMDFDKDEIAALLLLAAERFGSPLETAKHLNTHYRGTFGISEDAIVRHIQRLQESRRRKSRGQNRSTTKSARECRETTKSSRKCR
jgi:hypothetical protein